MKLFLLPLVIVALLALPAAAVIKKYKTGKKAKWAILANLGGFFALLAIAFFVPVGDLIALADGEVVTNAVAASADGMKYLAAAISTGLGSIGCGIAVAAAAPAAIGAVAEEPSSFVKALIFVAMGEGVAIYGLLISIFILNG